MSLYLLQREQVIDRPAPEVFDFFADAANLEAITPPWLKFRIVTPTPIEMRVGTRIEYRIQWHMVRMSWLSEIVEWDPPHRFTDLQLEGPYALWRHTHSFFPVESKTLMLDTVQYRLICGPVGAAVHHLKVRKDLAAIFDFRSKRIRQLLEKNRSLDEQRLLEYTGGSDGTPSVSQETRA